MWDLFINKLTTAYKSSKHLKLPDKEHERFTLGKKRSGKKMSQCAT